MKIKKMLAAGMIAVCLMTGCANPMVAIYDNDIKIASNTNSYNLNNYEQTAEDGHFTASVEKWRVWTPYGFLTQRKINL